MTVASFIGDDLFTFRVTKHLISNPADKWVNSYEFAAIDDGGTPELLALGTALVSFEQSIHFEDVVFDSLLISTWEEDSKPYNPLTLISSPLTGIGDISRATLELLSLNQCMDVRRFALSGRYGHIFYRACVTEDMVSAPAGKTVLNDREGRQAILDAGLASSELDGYIGSGAAGFRMVMVNKAGTNVRTISSLSVGGIANVKTDHKWFNRTTTP